MNKARTLLETVRQNPLYLYLIVAVSLAYLLVMLAIAITML